MIIGFGYLKEFLMKLNMPMFGTYTDEEVNNFLPPDSLSVWDILKKHFPQFHDIMNRAGQMSNYSILHGNTIHLLKKKFNLYENDLEKLFLVLIRIEYISQNLWDVHLFESLIENYRKRFSYNFYIILQNSYSTLYDDLIKHFDTSFHRQALLYSKIIEKTISLVAESQYIKLNRLNDGADYQAALESVTHYIESELEQD